MYCDNIIIALYFIGRVIMSGLVKTETLIDIARHSNKVIRISKFMQESDLSFLVDKMMYIDENSNSLDLVNAINDDLSTTANLIGSIALIVESTNADHKAMEFKGDENDLSVLFPDNYDKSTRTLTLFGVDIPSSGMVSKSSPKNIKAILYENVFGKMAERHTFDDFSKHLSNLKVIEKDGKPKKEDGFDVALKYAQRVGSSERWGGFYEKVMELSGNHNDFIKKLPKEARNIIDEKIISGRTSVYGVVKKSTYITKLNGLEQLSSKHKGNKELVDLFVKQFNETECLRALELDQDSSLEKMHDMLVFIKSLNFDSGRSFELKIRKLGNYRFSGVHASLDGNSAMQFMEEIGFASGDFELIGLDENSPISLIHEAAHLNDDPKDKLRNMLVSHFSEKMDGDLLSEFLSSSKVNYLTDNREVFARIGEIGFALNHLGYKEGETVQVFLDRISKEPEKEALEGQLYYNLAVSKGIDRFVAEFNSVNREMYFNLAKWSPEELSLVRDYSHNLFYSPDESLRLAVEQRVANGELNQLSENFFNKFQKGASRKVRRSEVDLVKKAFDGLSLSDIEATYRAGVRENVFSDGEFIVQLGLNGDTFGSNTKVTVKTGSGSNSKQRKANSDELWQMQIDAMSLLVKTIDKDQRPGDAMFMRELIRNYAVSSRAPSLLFEKYNISPTVSEVDTLNITIRELLKVGSLNQLPVKCSDESFEYGKSLPSLGSKSFHYKNSYAILGEKPKSRLDEIVKIKADSEQKFSEITFTPKQLRGASIDTQLAWASERIVNAAGPSLLSSEMKSLVRKKGHLDNLHHTFNVGHAGLEREAALLGVHGMTNMVTVGKVEASLYEQELIDYSSIASEFTTKYNIDKSALLSLERSISDLRDQPKSSVSDKYHWEKWSFDDKKSVSENLSDILTKLSRHPARNILSYKDPEARSRGTIGEDQPVASDSWVETAPTPLVALGYVVGQSESSIPRPRTEMINDLSSIITSHENEYYNFSSLANMAKSIVDNLSSSTYSVYGRARNCAPILRTVGDLVGKGDDSVLPKILISNFANDIHEQGANLVRSKNVMAHGSYDVTSIRDGESIKEHSRSNVMYVTQAVFSGLEVVIDSVNKNKFEFKDSPDYELVKDDFEDLVSNFELAVREINNLTPDVLTPLLQGLSNFTHPENTLLSSRKINKDTVSPDLLKKIDDFFVKSTAFMLDKKIAFSDVRPFIRKEINNFVPDGPNPTPENFIAEPTPGDVDYRVGVDEPNLESSNANSLENKKELVSVPVEESIYPKENSNVPSANGKMLSRENQFRLI